MDERKKKIDIRDIFKKIDKQDILLITTIMYFAIVVLFELYYCNFEFIIKEIKNYNLSIYRIIVYIIVYLVFYKFKDKFIKEAIDAFKSKWKAYFVIILFIFTTFLGILLISKIVINNQLNIYMIITFISLILFNLFSIYISNNMLKNTVVTALVFGFIFSISITFNNQLDEKIHFLSSYSIALGDFSRGTIDESIADMPRMMTPRGFIEFFNQKPTNEITKDLSNREITDLPCGYIVTSYFISGLGIFIARTLGGSIADIYITGRIFSLLGYIVLMVLTLKTLPYKKNIMFAVFFMPMLLALASVYSPDGIGAATIGLFVAYCFKLYEKNNIYKKDIVKLIILLILAASIKSVGYIAIALIVLILPLKKIFKENKRYMKYILILFIIIGSIAIFTFSSAINAEGDPRSEGTENSSQFQYVLENPLKYAKVLIKHTIFTFTNLDCMSFLNAPMFFINTYYKVFMLTISYILFISITDSTKHLTLKNRLIFIVTFLITFAMTSTAMYISYTRVGANYIDGFQMRYIFPILFLLLSSISVKKLELQNKFKFYEVYTNSIVSIFLMISILDVVL